MANNSRYQLEEKVGRLVDQAIKSKIFPGIEILLAKSGTILFHQAFGRLEGTANSPQLVKNSLFDLASLTKPLATATAVLHLVESGRLNLDEKATVIIPEFYRSETAKINIRQLLTHTSGLPDWIALYESNFDKSRGWKKLVRTGLQYEPGSEAVYSCLGFILLGEIVRRISKTSLSDYCKNFIFSPLDLPNLLFNPDPARSDIVPTAYCPLRKKTLRGIVHDENAFLFDGEGGNAGLFGTAEEIHRFCLMLLSGGEINGVRVFSPRAIRNLFMNHNPVSIPPRTLGWDYNTGNAEYMSCGDLMPAGSVGHLGFTGTSLWLDPNSKIVVILLSNRINLAREENIPLMRAFRPQMHDLLLSTIPEFVERADDI
ncbi:MAG: beta-lactamase family protein [Proteobacteria bacterium]|nr:beta-lactamase family protein [Pseudomonadota bacterium]